MLLLFGVVCRRAAHPLLVLGTTTDRVAHAITVATLGRHERGTDHDPSIDRLPDAMGCVHINTLPSIKADAARDVVVVPRGSPPRTCFPW